MIYFVIFIASSLAAMTTYGTLTYIDSPSMLVTWWWYFAIILIGLATYFGLFLLEAIWHYVFAECIKACGAGEEGKKNKYASHVLQQNIFLVLRLFRLHVRKNDFDKLPSKNEHAMFVYNHISNLDPLVMIDAFKDRDQFYIQKEQMKSVPIAGGYTKKAGYLFIKQDDMLSGKRVVDLSTEILKANKADIVVAPEGHRNKDYPQRANLPYHGGTFSMAYFSHCPIVVCAIENTHAVKDRFPFRSTKAYVDIVKVLHYEDYKNMKPMDLASHVAYLINERLEEKEPRRYHLRKKKK